MDGAMAADAALEDRRAPREDRQGTDAYLGAKAAELFRRLLAVGRGSAPPFRRPAPILDLKTLAALVPPESESAAVDQDVRVDRIVGTEDRSEDFAEGFYPRRAWMESRWVKVYKLLHGRGIDEPLDLIEYGGYYFVRDGNHRASVALHSGIEYLPAKVVRHAVPVGLPAFPGRRNLAVFKEKYEFQKRTGFFDYADEEDFSVRCPRTWGRLEKEVFVNSKAWVIKHRGVEDVAADHLIPGWMNFYKVSLEHIRSRGFMSLFPDMLETDVFVELVDFWNSYDDPDSLWIGEVYDRFERSVRRAHLLRWLAQEARLSLEFLSSTPDEAKCFFLCATRIKRFIPGFDPPRTGKAFYRLCYRQVFRHVPRLWMEREHSQPGLNDIAVRWHDAFYAPVVARYRESLYRLTFERYYRRFSAKHFAAAMSGSRPIAECLEEFGKTLA
jgi:hypothetical protein